MNFTEWKAEAMRLAWRCEETAISEFKSIASEEELSATRAALEAHLEALPMGEAVGYVFAPHLEILDYEDSMALTVTRKPSGLGFVTPLYRHPKESA